MYFKTTDDPGTFFYPLTDINTWRIKVSAPASEPLDAALMEDDRIRLTWAGYDYGADRIRISRRIVDYDLPGSACFTGIPGYARYDSITEIKTPLAEFIDTHPDGRFPRGASVCYRLLAIIPGCTETESAPSENICIQIPVDAPVITNVSMLETDEADGRAYVRWTSSFDMDLNAHDPSQFSYRLQRAEGFRSKTNARIITPRNFRDTVFVDTGINTKDKIYNYTVFLYEGKDLIDSSATASTVRLSSEPLPGKIAIQWEADVPWSINTQIYPWHYIFRDQVTNDDPFGMELIDSVNVNYNGYHFVDSSEKVMNMGNQSFCYYVVTTGSYGNPKIPEPLLNNSQVFCTHPFDTIPPCPPDVTIENNTEEFCRSFAASVPCDYSNYSNQLNIIPGCHETDIAGYNVYYSESYDGPFSFIAFTEDNQYLHEGLRSFKGCYRASAVDFSGNESQPGVVVCRDNCPNLMLPNIFTPNSDGSNDRFTEILSGPDNCPRFIENVDFSVYNRFGKKIYQNKPDADREFLIQWDGYTHAGMKVPAGIYFYEARVFYDMLNHVEQMKFYKGWIEVLY